MEKPYIVEDRCVECKHCVYEYDMWLCTHHKIDLEMVNVEECEDFSEGNTVEYAYRMNNCKESLQNTLKYSKSVDKNFHIEHTFLYGQIESILNSQFIWDKEKE